jgi:hypothetical protein
MKAYSVDLRAFHSTILRTVFGTILQALQGKHHKKVELNASQG